MKKLLKLLSRLFYKTVNPIRRLLAIIRTRLSIGENKDLHELAKAGALVMWVAGQNPENRHLWDNVAIHPLHNQRAKLHEAYIETHPKKDLKVWAFGDSLKDIPKNEFTAVPAPTNCAISGSRSHQMVHMARVVHNKLVQEGKADAPVIVYVGTLEGNGYLVGQPVEEGIRRAVLALDEFRKMFPKGQVKMVVDALPPTFSIWANLARKPFEEAVKAWVKADGNAVMISYMEMGEWTPDVWLSNDGVHQTDVGTVRLDNAMIEAKKAKPGSVIYA